MLATSFSSGRSTVVKQMLYSFASPVNSKSFSAQRQGINGEATTSLDDGGVQAVEVKKHDKIVVEASLSGNSTKSVEVEAVDITLLGKKRLCEYKELFI